jgi:recombination associated protein RdgC
MTMWFKNLQIYRLTAPMAAQTLEEALATRAFQPCGNIDMQAQGWVSPRENDQLVHTVNQQMLIALCTEKKLLPSAVIKEAVKIRTAEFEDQQGFKPGRKQTKEIKEQVTDELLPNAFTLKRITRVWIDPVNMWLVVDAASPSKADEVFRALIRSVEVLPINTLRVVRSPVAAMTDWLAADEAPAGFTVDQDTELRATGEGKATVKYVRHTPEAADVRRHIAAGKQCIKLAMTWSDRISFVMTEGLTIRRIDPLDVLKETEATTQNDDERFDTDFVLMAGEFSRMLNDLVAALGGEGPPEKGQLDIDDLDKLQKTSVESDSDVVDADFDEVYAQAVKLVREHDRASISMVQRYLQIGYNLAARYIEQMEQEGIISIMDKSGNRKVIPETIVA